MQEGEKRLSGFCSNFAFFVIMIYKYYVEVKVMDVQNTARYDQAVSALCCNLRMSLKKVPDSAKCAALEVRLRAGGPIALTCPGQTWFLGPNGELHNLPQQGLVVTRQDLDDSVVSMCSHSVHSHQHEMKQGFISLQGGHRAGICGTAVVGEGRITALRDITSVNLRIARQVQGAADLLVEKIFRDKPCGVLIAGPPSSGKTTLLRDLARQLASGKTGKFLRVAVVDERCELGAVYEGVVQNYLGPCCDLLSGYPKGQGILMAIRTLSPQVVVCDEIGSSDEVDSILDGLSCGVHVVASVHAGSVGEALRRRSIRKLLEQGAFERVALLDGEGEPGTIKTILEVGELLSESSGNRPHRSLLLNDGRVHGVRVIETSVHD